MARLKQRGADLCITTNGSYKTQEWWTELVSNLTSTDLVVFSVDGTPNNFTKYRVNADWQSIRAGMEIVAKSQCNSIWKYIPFAFNQQDIETVEQLSQKIGIKNFRVELSDRFDEQTRELMPDVSLLGSRYMSQVKWKSGQSDLTLNPKCHSGQEHFITADGYYTPCCYLADHRFYYKTPFGKNKKQYNIGQHILSEILQQSNTVEFYQNLDQQPGCQFNCPNTDG